MYASVTMGHMPPSPTGPELEPLLLPELDPLLEPLLLPELDPLLEPLLLPELEPLLEPLLLPELPPPSSPPGGVTTLLPLLPQAAAETNAASAGANQMSAVRFPRRRLMLLSPDSVAEGVLRVM
jgi:hypothetical protein